MRRNEPLVDYDAKAEAEHQEYLLQQKGAEIERLRGELSQAYQVTTQQATELERAEAVIEAIKARTDLGNEVRKILYAYDKE